jgi:colicin import membrane protein
MKSGVTISTAAHALLLAWGLLSFSAKPFDAATAESLPVDVISATEFSQMTAGAKTAPKAETPKPVVEKIADTTPPPKDLTAKISDKPAIEAAKDDAPPPVPEVKPQPDKKPPEEKKPDEIAEAIKKEIVKPPPAPKKPPPPKLDLSKIENKLALLDKREQRRAAVTGDTINTTPTLGTSTGKAASLSMTEIDALRSRLMQCWNPPAGVADAKDLIVQVQFQLQQDGSLIAMPRVMNRGSNALFQVAAESAVRAVQRCAPFNFLPAAKYDAWKEVEINFDPRDMFRG